MLKPTYRNRGGKMMQEIKISMRIDGEMLVSVVAYMAYMEKKINKTSVEEELRATLWSGGTDKVHYLYEYIYEDKREECLEKGEVKARELFPEFFV